MKKIVYFCLCTRLMFYCTSAFSQEQDTLSVSMWSHNLEADFYIYKNNFIFLPIYAVDKGWLHMEARYNYEDMNTFSAWFGYNFNGGKKFQYTVTPMIGGIAGNTNGIAPGLLLDLEFRRFNLNSESEYVLAINDKEDNFYYNWTDLIYAPRDWIWFGMSAQLTRLYQTDVEIQRGLVVGGSYKWLGLSGYLYNVGFDNPYIILSLSITPPKH